jgi:hypothetical protein
MEPSEAVANHVTAITTSTSEVGPGMSRADNPPPLTPDIWLAATTAAMQTYVDLGTATQPVTAATISSVLGQAQTKQLISPPVATSILDLVPTSEGAVVIAGSAALATRAVAYITTHAAAPMTAHQAAPPQPAASEAVPFPPADGEAAAAGIQISPASELTAAQVVAVLESTNAVLGNAGKPAFPSLAFSRAEAKPDAGPASGSSGTSGSGNSGTSNPDSNLNEPGLEEDWLGSVVVGVGLTVIEGVATGAEAVEIAVDASADVLGEVVPGAVGLIMNGIDSFLNPPGGPPDSDGMGSGAGAPPGSIEDGDDDGDGTGDDTGGATGGGGGSGIDDSRGQAAH